MILRKITYQELRHLMYQKEAQKEYQYLFYKLNFHNQIDNLLLLTLKELVYLVLS